MAKKGFVLVLLILLAAILIKNTSLLDFRQELNTAPAQYAEKGPQEVGAANLVTAVIVTYRGLDTLGEVAILFLTASIIGFFLKTKEKNNVPRKIREASEILETAAKILTPLIFLFGTYVFINGHLTPGGGFQGGAILASGVVLMLLANPTKQLSHVTLSILESISGVAFIILGILGIFLAGGFLDNDYPGLGEFGTLLSAGAIPVIYIFIGLKVGAELSGIVSNLQETQKEEV
ncbi:MAG: Na(+)/H(+) antiporter subunit B [Bacteroidales bacterium]